MTLTVTPPLLGLGSNNNQTLIRGKIGPIIEPLKLWKPLLGEMPVHRRVQNSLQFPTTGPCLSIPNSLDPLGRV